MITFSISLIALILGYFLYGKFVESVFEPSAKRKTPGIRKFDGVDYLVLPAWKIIGSYAPDGVLVMEMPP